MEHKVAIVTASATGIGKAIIYELASQGCSVVVTSRDLNHIEPVVADLISKGRDAIGIVCDVSKKEDRTNLVQKTLLKYGKINYLVCNAAVDYISRNTLEMPEEKIKELWDINYHSVFQLVKEARPHLKK
jgi:dehydrogenase/reductase SDR family protein 4